MLEVDGGKGEIVCVGRLEIVVADERKKEMHRCGKCVTLEAMEVDMRAGGHSGSRYLVLSVRDVVVVKVLTGQDVCRP